MIHSLIHWRLFDLITFPLMLGPQCATSHISIISVLSFSPHTFKAVSAGDLHPPLDS